MKLILIDNDVLLKVTGFEISGCIERLLHRPHVSLGILSSAKFVVRSRLERKSDSDPNLYQAWDDLYAISLEISPDNTEIQLAAEIEEVAMLENVDLDVGESLLLAVLFNRDARVVITGDKRAIVAVRRIFHEIELKRNCIASFEQLVMRILLIESFQSLRTRICRRQRVDRTMSICFSCSSTHTTQSATQNALRSYISDIRLSCMEGLIEGEDLSQVIA